MPNIVFALSGILTALWTLWANNVFDTELNSCRPAFQSTYFEHVKEKQDQYRKEALDNAFNRSKN